MTRIKELVPEPLRASGQALFAAIAFGGGGTLGYWLTGTTYAAGGGRAAFWSAALFELAAALVLILLMRRPGVVAHFSEPTAAR